jgi:hypothetical protein
MKNDFEKNKVIPIEHGEEIKLDKLDKKIGEVQAKISDLIRRILDLEIEKEKQLEDELKKPASEQDSELISLLQQDLEDLRKDEGELMDAMTESLEDQSGIRDRIIELWNRIDKRH